MRNDPLPLSDPGGLGIFAVMAGALTPLPFQPDYRARREIRERAMPAVPRKVSKPTRTDPRTPTDAEPAAPRRGLVERLEHWFWTQRQKDLEAYLAQSTDIHDLEARIRDLERNPIHPYY